MFAFVCSLLIISLSLRAETIPADIPPDPTPLTLAVGMSTTVQLPHLARAAVADGKIARVRSVSPSALLITGLRAGNTMVRAWSAEGREWVYQVAVVSRPLSERMNRGAERGVVKVALEFLELDRAFTRGVGIRWPDTIHFNGSAALQGSADNSGLNYVLTFTSAQGWLQSLVREGWARILAQPDLYVRLGEEAVFHSGGEIPVPSATETYGREYRHVEWKPFGLTVKVRPESGDSLHISSDIRLELSELNPAASVEGIPALTRRQLDTKMDSLDGETVILSGLLRQVGSEEKEGVPVLSSIPLLGSLFSRRGQSHQETEIFVAVTFSLTTRSAEKEKAAVESQRLKPPGWGEPWAR
jgi:Flp pilus assembly secretin CpaC